MITHLVNPVIATDNEALRSSQELTFESIRRAAEACPEVRIELLTAQYAEDHPMIPPAFRPTPDLERSAIDFGDFERHKKLPLLRDLLQRLYDGSDTPYLIYTNMDIILHPDFYRRVVERIESGLDAFIINRRRIPDEYTRVDQLPEIFALEGAPHPGFDCFVFHRSMFESFVLEKVCVGIPFVGMLLAQNLFCWSRRFALYDQDVLTYHLGMEIFPPRDEEYLAFNKREFWTAMDQLLPHMDSRRFPWGDRNVIYRMIRWGLHPSIPIRLALRLEPRRWDPRRR